MFLLYIIAKSRLIWTPLWGTGVPTLHCCSLPNFTNFWKFGDTCPNEALSFRRSMQVLLSRMQIAKHKVGELKSGKSNQYERCVKNSCLIEKLSQECMQCSHYLLIKKLFNILLYLEYVLRKNRLIKHQKVTLVDPYSKKDRKIV